MTEPVHTGFLKWPYAVNYGKETKVSGDVLIIGSGMAGCFAAISAAKKGAKVIAVDKASIKISGSGGTGVDHWHFACTNPCCTVPPDEMIEVVKTYPFGVSGETGLGPTCYVTCVEGYDALLDLEKAGATIRDTNNEFAGAEFRDDKTKLMFAFDYDGKHTLRIPGSHYKGVLAREMKRLGVKFYEHIMVTSLLTEGGKTGARVIGACGVNVRTGEFYIFKTKATVLATMHPYGIWTYSTERYGLYFGDPNTGSGYALAWNAGAEFMMMEASVPARAISSWAPSFGAGAAFATWYACTLVDANGKEIPWINRDGEILKTVSQRYHASPGQKFFLYTAPHLNMPYKYRAPSLILDLGERILNGEYELPLYADLPGMPEHERRAIWGLMVGNEGLTRYLVYKNYSMAGFDPDKDMLEVESLPQEAMLSKQPAPPRLGPSVRDLGFVGGFGGLVTDWNLKTSLEGLYAAGSILAGGADYSASCCSGRYAGRKAAEYSQQAPEPVVDRVQLDKEKERVYAPVRRKTGIEWKELQFQLNRITQDYCPEYKNERMLKLGLDWIDDIKGNEVETVLARNPHELQRCLECVERITTGEIVMQSSLLRKASSAPLGFKRLDYPEVDPPEWQKYITVKLEEGGIKSGELPLNYWLLPPNAPTYRENYEQHCGL
jgi:succinate dehydrogenase/fumarate reductase flavoprotein subunit